MPLETMPCGNQELWDRIRQGLQDVNIWAVVSDSQTTMAAFLRLLDPLAPATPGGPAIDILLTERIKFGISRQHGKVDGGELTLPDLCWMFIPHSILSQADLDKTLRRLSGGPPQSNGVDPEPGEPVRLHFLLPPVEESVTVADTVLTVAQSEGLFVFDQASLN